MVLCGVCVMLLGGGRTHALLHVLLHRVNIHVLTLAPSRKPEYDTYVSQPEINEKCLSVNMHAPLVESIATVG